MDKEQFKNRVTDMAAVLYEHILNDPKLSVELSQLSQIKCDQFGLVVDDPATEEQIGLFLYAQGVIISLVADQLSVIATA